MHHEEPESSMLVVPAKAFQDPISQLDLKPVFPQICEYELPGGLCGRCGLLGDHWTHECPTLGFGPVRQRDTQDEKAMHKLDISVQGYLRANRLVDMAECLVAEGVKDLEALAAVDLQQLVRDHEHYLSESTLSHCKLDAGTEAHLMRGEIEALEGGL